jgi:hypothetical protein
VTSKREKSARIAMEYITARASDVRDRTAEEVLTDASHDVHHLVDGLTRLVVGLARRLATAESITVEEVLQHEVLRLMDDAAVAAPVVPPTEIPTPEPHEVEPTRVRVRRLEVPKQAAAFEDDDELPPDQWTA